MKMKLQLRMEKDLTLFAFLSNGDVGDVAEQCYHQKSFWAVVCLTEVRRDEMNM